LFVDKLLILSTELPKFGRVGAVALARYDIVQVQVTAVGAKPPYLRALPHCEHQEQPGTEVIAHSDFGLPSKRLRWQLVVSWLPALP